MQYIGNNQYKCIENKIPIITVLPENLPIVCTICQEKQSKIEEIDTPSTIDKIKGFSSAMTRWAKSGFQTVDSKEYKNRIDICKSCEYFDKGRCRICGCFMIAKCWLASEECPKQKWLQIDNDTTKEVAQ